MLHYQESLELSQMTANTMFCPKDIYILGPTKDQWYLKSNTFISTRTCYTFLSSFYNFAAMSFDRKQFGRHYVLVDLISGRQSRHNGLHVVNSWFDYKSLKFCLYRLNASRWNIFRPKVAKPVLKSMIFGRKNGGMQSKPEF